MKLFRKTIKFLKSFFKSTQRKNFPYSYILNEEHIWRYEGNKHILEREINWWAMHGKYDFPEKHVFYMKDVIFKTPGWGAFMRERVFLQKNEFFIRANAWIIDYLLVLELFVRKDLLDEQNFELLFQMLSTQEDVELATVLILQVIAKHDAEVRKLSRSIF